MRKEIRKRSPGHRPARSVVAKTGPVVQAADVSLRRPRGTGVHDHRKMVSFRLPPDAIAYYSGEAKANNRGQVDIVLEAIYLDRDLGRLLAEMRPSLERAATAMGLNLDYDLAEVLARLVRTALESQGAKATEAKPAKK